jgi:hypothetical protein
MSLRSLVQKLRQPNSQRNSTSGARHQTTRIGATRFLSAFHSPANRPPREISALQSAARMLSPSSVPFSYPQSLKYSYPRLRILARDTTFHLALQHIPRSTDPEIPRLASTVRRLVPPESTRLKPIIELRCPPLDADKLILFLKVFCVFWPLQIENSMVVFFRRSSVEWRLLCRRYVAEIL